MEIDLYSKLQDPLNAIDRMGEFFAKSGMFGCERVEQGKVLAMICLSEKKSPVAISRTYHIIEGKLSKKALACLAEFRQAGGKHKWLETGDNPSDEDSRRAVGEFTFEGQTMTVSFSMADAKRQFLVRPKSNWEKTPANMLRARVITNAIGMLCPEIFAGDDSDDEPRPVTAATVTLLPTPPQSDAQAEIAAGLAPMKAIPVTVTPVQEQFAGPTESNPAQLTPAATAQPPPSAPIPAVGPASPGVLPAETVTKLEQSLAEHGAKATAWMFREGWLKPGQTLENLTAVRAAKILKQTKSFIEVINRP